MNKQISKKNLIIINTDEVIKNINIIIIKINIFIIYSHL